jgi:hypothetical protein
MFLKECLKRERNLNCFKAYDIVFVVVVVCSAKA